MVGGQISCRGIEGFRGNMVNLRLKTMKSGCPLRGKVYCEQFGAAVLFWKLGDILPVHGYSFISMESDVQSLLGEETAVRRGWRGS